MTRVFSVWLLPLIAACLVGCSETGDKTPVISANNEPQTFQEAVEQIVQLRDTIRDGFAAGDIDAAHGPLHEVGDVLTQIETLAKAGELSEQDLTAVTDSTQSLLDAFGEVDKTLHGGDGSTYDEEAQTIDAVIAVLAEIANVPDTLELTRVKSDDGDPDDTVDVIDAQPKEDPVAAPIAEPVEAPAPE